MTPDHDPTRRPRVYYEEDLEELPEDKATGAIASMVVVVGAICAVLLGFLIAGIMLFDKYKHWLGL